MRIGFNLLLWTTDVGEADLPHLHRLKAAGYDGVEVPIFTGTPRHYASLARQLGDIGLAATAIAITPDQARNPLSPDPAERAAGLDHLKWLVDCAAALGAGVLAGPYYQPLGQFSGTGPTLAEWDRLVAAHQAMADHAPPGLTLAVEPLNRFECYALNTCADAARLVRAVDRPNYGYLYDSFHANIEERSPTAALAATMAQLAHVHISENDRGTPGRGHIDFAALLTTLAQGGYDGWLTIEAFGHALPDIAAATKVWRPLFDSEAEVYTEGIALIKTLWTAAKGTRHGH